MLSPKDWGNDELLSRLTHETYMSVYGRKNVKLQKDSVYCDLPSGGTWRHRLRCNRTYYMCKIGMYSHRIYWPRLGQARGKK